MFKKLLASVGIGSAKVDTFILTEHLEPGADCDIQVVIKASDSVEQDINGLALTLCTAAKSEKEMGDSEVTINETVVLGRWEMSAHDLGLKNGILVPGQTLEFDMTITLHPETPVTDIENSTSKVWLSTGLDIDKGLDSSDKDYMAIQPTELQINALKAMADMGYTLFKVDVEKGRVQGQGFASQVNCYQEFEFRRSSGLFSKSEVELTFVSNGEHIGLLLEKDRFLGGDAYYSQIVRNDANFQSVKSVLEQWL